MPQDGGLKAARFKPQAGGAGGQVWRLRQRSVVIRPTMAGTGPAVPAIGAALPIPPEPAHPLLDGIANQVEVEAGKNDKCFEGYSEER